MDECLLTDEETDSQEGGMNKLIGSAKAKLSCSNCLIESPIFHVTMAWNDEEGYLWYPKRDYPQGWEDDDEAELNFYDSEDNLTDMVDGVMGIVFLRCPTCIKDL